MVDIKGMPMSKTGIAKVFKHGRSQAVRLPAEFRVTGEEVRVRRVEGGILLEPLYTDIDEWFAEMDRHAQHRFMEEGRNQPPMPKSKVSFD
jgi:antitoxin VapB